MTGRRGRPTAAEAIDRDERVIDVVVALLTSEGYDATALDRVSVEANVAKRTLYSVFGGRSGLVRAAVRRQHAYLAEAWRTAGDLRAASVAVVTRLLSDEAVGIHRAIVIAAAGDTEPAVEFYAEGPERAQRFLGEYLPTDAAVPVDLLFTALLGETHRRRVLGIDEKPDEAEIVAHVDRTLRVLGLAES